MGNGLLSKKGVPGPGAEMDMFMDIHRRIPTPQTTQKTQNIYAIAQQNALPRVSNLIENLKYFE